LGAQNVFSQGRIFAVIVGVSEYQNPSGNLSYSHRDAIDMYQLLRPYTLPERIKLLTNSEARHDNIVYYAQQLFRQAKAEDVVIFYFSGHGSYNLFCTYDQYLYFATLQRIFKECKANRKMIFADSCHAGSLRQEGNSAATTTNNQNAGKNVMLFMASRSNQYSFEDGGLQNGSFTYFLISGLKGAADVNKDSYITAFELFSYVNPKVKERSKGVQVPVMWGKFNKNMVILKTR